MDSDDEGERNRLNALLDEAKMRLEQSEEEKQSSLNKLEVLQVNSNPKSASASRFEID